MPKRSKSNSDDGNEKNDKKEKIIPFSTTDYLKTKIKIGDKSASMVGYVEEIFSEETFTNKIKNIEFKIFKFLLNNNDGIKIQCNAYDDTIKQFSSQIKIDEKILLETVTVTKAKGYTKGNLNYELNLQHYSTITVIGDATLIKSLQPQVVKFREIPIKRGLIKIQGYLRNCFVQKHKNNDNEYFGVITDGKYKLDIQITKNQDDKLDIEKGSKLEVIGDLQEQGKSFILHVKDMNHLKILSDEKMDLENLIMGCEIFLINDEKEKIKEENLNSEN